MTLGPLFYYDSLAFFIGLFAAAAEILPRYRDEPAKALATGPGALYLLFNGALSLLAFRLCMETTNVDPVTSRFTTLQYAVIGGVGAVVLLRAKFFTIKVGKEEHSLGPGNIISAILAYLDRQIDRRRARVRARIVKRVMTGIDFTKAVHHVLVMVSGGMQNLTREEQESLGQRIGAIAAGGLPPQEKSYSLGFVVLDYMGEGFLRDDLFKEGRPRFEVEPPE